MAKHSRRSRSHSNARTKRRGQHGGNLAGNPASAWGWVNGTVGNGWTQFMNSLTLKAGDNLGTVGSNDVVPIKNLNAQDAQGMIGPGRRGDIPGQKGGRRKRHGKGKRGGSFLAVANQAIVPGALLAFQETFGRKSRRHGKSSRRHHSRRHR